VSNVEDHLELWLRAGVVDAANAERIRAFERAEAKPASDDRPGVLEVLVYLGVIVAAIGAVFLVAQNWDELERWARIGAVAAPALLALLAGWVLIQGDEPELRRAGQAAWLVAVGLTAATVLVIGNEAGGDDLGDDGERNVLLLAAAISLGLALALWVLAESHPQLLAVAGTIFFLAQALGQWPDDFNATLAGATLFVCGLTGLVAAIAGAAGPGPAARAVFGLLTVAGPYEAGLDGNVQWAELSTFLVAAALLGVSVQRGHFSLTIVGVADVFVALITYVFEHFEDDIGAPVALMVSGGVVVGGVLLLVQLREVVRERRRATA
jgi:predicted membrane protein DUF2157